MKYAVLDLKGQETQYIAGVPCRYDSYDDAVASVLATRNILNRKGQSIYEGWSDQRVIEQYDIVSEGRES